jgi:hypothetical protein
MDCWDAKQCADIMNSLQGHTGLARCSGKHWVSQNATLWRSAQLQHMCIHTAVSGPAWSVGLAGLWLCSCLNLFF